MTELLVIVYSSIEAIAYSLIGNIVKLIKSLKV